jgi:hypothetical protein
MKITYDKRRTPLVIGWLALIAGIGLWLQGIIVLFQASVLTGPVTGPFASIALQLLFSGPLMIIGTYILTKNADLLLKDLHLKN